MSETPITPPTDLNTSIPATVSSFEGTRRSFEEKLADIRKGQIGVGALGAYVAWKVGALFGSVDVTEIANMSDLMIDVRAQIAQKAANDETPGFEQEQIARKVA